MSIFDGFSNILGGAAAVSSNQSISRQRSYSTNNAKPQSTRQSFLVSSLP